MWENCIFSIQNWIEDLYWKELDCDYPGASDAKVCLAMNLAFSVIVRVKSLLHASSIFQVHHGFYSAYHNTTVRPGILNAVESAKELYGDLQIMVTGHSMGGAMAAFCGLDLAVLTSMPS